MSSTSHGADVSAGKPWGPGLTIAFSIGIFGIWVIVHTAVVIVFIFSAHSQNPSLNIEAYSKTLETNGNLFTAATCAASPIEIALILICAGLRRGISLRDYLALRRFNLKMFCIGLGATLLFVIVSDSITLLLGRPIVPEVMVKVYQSAGSPLLLILAMVILAPFTEELFFRGFLFEGLSVSRLGPIGAVLLTSAAWSVVHAQYDLYGIATIFADGLLLGVIRWKTGSTLLTMVLHGLANLIAALEIEYLMLR